MIILHYKIYIKLIAKDEERGTSHMKNLYKVNIIYNKILISTSMLKVQTER